MPCAWWRRWQGHLPLSDEIPLKEGMVRHRNFPQQRGAAQKFLLRSSFGFHFVSSAAHCATLLRCLASAMAYYPAEPMPAPYGGVPLTTATFGGYTLPMPVSGLDHSQGKWFAPGEALPPGFMVTSHPDGHTEPQSHHLMSEKARESFVITTGSAALKTGSALKKKSKKKKSSGCC